jgi:hypothetical protein
MIVPDAAASGTVPGGRTPGTTPQATDSHGRGPSRAGTSNTGQHGDDSCEGYGAAGPQGADSSAWRLNPATLPATDGESGSVGGAVGPRRHPTDKEIADRVRACQPCSANHAKAWSYVHIGDGYEDGCYGTAAGLLHYLMTGET